MTKQERIERKILPLHELLKLRQQWKLFGKKTVFTNGCFDILHRGHTTYLLQAAELGNKLIVAVNSDASVQRLKGENRPIFDQDARALNLAAHTFIDAVIVFNEDTPLQLIEQLLPEVLVKGGDYTLDTIVGADVVKQHGGEVCTIPLVPNTSTTLALEKIMRL